MGWFTRNPVVDEKASVIEKLEDQIDSLTEAKVRLTEENARLKESSARESREIEHKVGLHRIQVEAESKIAADRARLEVERANLNADKSRFEENLKFTRDQMNQQLGDMKDILKSIINRLPEEKVRTTITRTE